MNLSLQSSKESSEGGWWGSGAGNRKKKGKRCWDVKETTYNVSRRKKTVKRNIVREKTRGIKGNKREARCGSPPRLQGDLPLNAIRQRGKNGNQRDKSF